MYQAYLILYLGLDIKIKYFCFTTYMRGSVSLEGVNLFVRGISGILRIVLLYLNYMFYNYIGWIFPRFKKRKFPSKSHHASIYWEYFLFYMKDNPVLRHLQSMLYTYVLYVQFTLVAKTGFFKKMFESIKFIGKLISSSRQSFF